MSKSKNSEYCVIDHANKQADRLRENPNVGLLRRAKLRAGDLSEPSRRDSDLVRGRSGKTC